MAAIDSSTASIQLRATRSPHRWPSQPRSVPSTRLEPDPILSNAHWPPKAHDAVARQRKERAERERRIEALAVRVLTAVEERDAAVDWLGEQISVRDATRLRQLTVRDPETAAATVKATATPDEGDAQTGSE
jgi:hypothetical protein